MTNNAKMTDPRLLIQAGMDPKTGLPIRMPTPGKYGIDKAEIKKQLRIVDE